MKCAGAGNIYAHKSDLSRCLSQLFNYPRKQTNKKTTSHKTRQKADRISGDKGSDRLSLLFRVTKT